jgi:hypothetical protein
MEAVEKRDKDTLLYLIKKWIAPGNIQKYNFALKLN